MRISDWSSDVCSSDLGLDRAHQPGRTGAQNQYIRHEDFGVRHLGAGAPSRCRSRHSGAIHTGRLAGASGGRPRMMSDAFSPTMMVGALRLPLVMVGNTELSTTRNPSTPITRSAGSTTAWRASEIGRANV